MIGDLPKLNSNYKAIFRFEDLTDFSGNGYTLTNTNNAAVFSSSRFGKGANLAAANSLLVRATSIGVANNSASIGVLCKILTAPSGSGQGIIRLDFADNDTSLYIWYSDSGGTKTLSFKRDKKGVAAQGPTYNNNLGTTDYHLLGITYDGSNVRGYLDGVLVGGPTAASGSGNNGLLDGFYFGAASTNPADQHAYVHIDNGFAYAGVLSDQDWLAMWNQVAWKKAYMAQGY